MSRKQTRAFVCRSPAASRSPHGHLQRESSKQAPPESSSGKQPIGFLLPAPLLLAASLPLRAEKALEEIASFPNQQVTGVTVSPQGRIFVNFPFWSDDHTTSVAEIVDGKPKPFPDAKWNAKDGPAQARWICVQSVVVDDQGALWVLDPASPKTEGVVKGGAKLVKIDLGTNKVVQMVSFDDTTAPAQSYLNDVRVDTKTDHAFITESGTGAPSSLSI